MKISLGFAGGAFARLLSVSVLAMGLAGCADGVQNSRGIATHDVDPALRGPVAGVGVEAQDINSISDRIVRDMLQSPLLANAQRPPQILMDSSNFRNESAQQINLNIITDNLRDSLNNAANGRMIFVARGESTAIIERERALKRSGTVDTGTSGLTRATAGVDYGLHARIASIDAIDPANGLRQRYTQFSFEMLDMERGTIIWSHLYKINRAAADDVVYR